MQKTREEFCKTTDALANVFRLGSTHVAVPSTGKARESFRAVLQEIPSQNLLANQSLQTVISFLALAHRLDVIADGLDICRTQALALTIERYWGDYGL